MTAQQNTKKISKRERNFWMLVILSMVLAIITWHNGVSKPQNLIVDPNNPDAVLPSSIEPTYNCDESNPFSEKNLATWSATNAPGSYNATVIDLVNNCTYSAGNPDAVFPMASTGKVMVATGVLEKVGRGEIDFLSIQSDLIAMITQSDNNAADRLYAVMGKTAAMQDLEMRYGLSKTSTDSGWGTTRTTSADQAKLLSQVIGTRESPLPEAQRIILRDLMKSVNPQQSWGAGTNIPTGWTVAVKNGWYQSVSGDLPPVGLWRVNTVGFVWDQDGVPRWIYTAFSNEWPTQAAGISAWNDFASLITANLAS